MYAFIFWTGCPLNQWMEGMYLHTYYKHGILDKLMWTEFLLDLLVIQSIAHPTPPFCFMLVKMSNF